MYKNILIPIDLAEQCSWERALPVATDLVKAFGGTLHIMTVVRDVDALWKAQYSLLSYEILIAEAERRLAICVADNVPKELEAQTIIGHGSIYAEILRIAENVGAELIVMARTPPKLCVMPVAPSLSYGGA